MGAPVDYIANGVCNANMDRNGYRTKVYSFIVSCWF